ncbi:MAG: protein kinase [Chloroflexota bacterium]
MLEPCAPVALGAEWSRGAFGSVHVVDTVGGRIAVKRVPDVPGHVNRELETCVRLASEPHPSIVRMLGYWHEGTGVHTTLFLVMEFVPETLCAVLARLEASGMRMKTDRMSALVSQLAGALAHLERIRLVHRDVKPDNVLVDVRVDRLVLADFGSAKFVEPGVPSATYVCTRYYRAPELILDRDLYSTSVDVWAFGCVLGEFARGGPLFRGDTQVEVLASIIRTRGMVTADDIAHMPAHRTEAGDVPVGPRVGPTPWSKVFTRRVGGRRVVTSYGAWYERALDACLQWSPAKRISARALVLLLEK